jgi:hypothetical protein
MKLDFIGTLFDGEIMVFIPCMNQAGQMLVLRSHGEWTKTRIMMTCQTTRQRLEKGPRKKQLERNENWRKEMVQLAASDCKRKRCTVSSLAFFFSLAIYSQKAMLKIKNCYNQVLFEIFNSQNLTKI